MLEADADAGLVRLAQSGDARAFEALVVKYQRRIARHVARYVKRTGDVEVVQEAFIRAYRGLASFRGESAFYSWLYRIATNSALACLKRGSGPVVLQVKAGMFIVDTCSVKVYPAQILEKYLGSVEQLSIIFTHPMFGPDSGANGVEGMTIVFWPFQTTGEGAEFFRRMFSQLGLNIVEITPDEHDRMAANSQGVTHQIGRILEEMKVQPTPIDTCGYQDLLSVVKQTTNDTWELFCGLQNYNPYTREMRYRLEAAIERINSFLLPERISAEGYIIGIQGGLGSFNEEACRHYCSLHAAEIPEYQIQYCRIRWRCAHPIIK